MTARTKTERLRDIIVASSMTPEEKSEAIDVTIEIEQANARALSAMTEFAEVLTRYPDGTISAMGKTMLREIAKP